MTRKPTQPTQPILLRELRDARTVIEAQSNRINRLGVIIEERNRIIESLTRILERSKIEIARLNGYIDRVREAEGRSTYEGRHCRGRADQRYEDGRRGSRLHP